MGLFPVATSDERRRRGRDTGRAYTVIAALSRQVARGVRQAMTARSLRD